MEGKPLSWYTWWFCHNGCCRLLRANSSVSHLDFYQSLGCITSEIFLSFLRHDNMCSTSHALPLPILPHSFWSIYAHAVTRDYAHAFPASKIKQLRSDISFEWQFELLRVSRGRSGLSDENRPVLSTLKGSFSLCRFNKAFWTPFNKAGDLVKEEMKVVRKLY